MSTSQTIDRRRTPTTCENLKVDPISTIFAPVLGLPSWNVQTGDLWYVTMEFGDPELVIGNVREFPLHLEGAATRRMRRPIRLDGQWGLNIATDNFALLLDNVVIAGSSSSRDHLDKALYRVLNGQALTGVRFNSSTGSTDFTFDLGATFRTLRSQEPDNEHEDQWLLSEPTGDWFVLNDAGQYSQHSGTTKPDEVVWQSLPSRRP